MSRRCVTHHACECHRARIIELEEALEALRAVNEPAYTFIIQFAPGEVCEGEVSNEQFIAAYRQAVTATRGNGSAYAGLVTALNIIARMPAKDGRALLIEELDARGLLEHGRGIYRRGC